jgi:threonine 3-dehydrogenase
MRKPVVLITGAGGEIGHGLIDRLAERGDRGIVTLDLNRLQPSIATKVDREITGSILDRGLLERVLAEFRVELVFHLAALLSTRSEFTPVTAHQVNVEGTLNLLEFAQHEAESHGRPVVFMYPSSIAAYGLPNRHTKDAAGKIKEDEWAHPTTMYGCNKLYCEQIGRY